MSSSLLKNPRAAPRGVAKQLKMLIYCRVNSAFSLLCALPGIQRKLFQQTAEAQHSDFARADHIRRKSVKISGLFMVLLTIFCHNTVFGEVLPDPTRPPEYRNSTNGAGTNAAPRFVLSSTLIAPGRRLATINGKSVAVGDQIAGAQVVAIEPSHVALREGAREFVLELVAKNFKRMH